MSRSASRLFVCHPVGNNESTMRAFKLIQSGKYQARFQRFIPIAVAAVALVAVMLSGCDEGNQSTQRDSPGEQPKESDSREQTPERSPAPGIPDARPSAELRRENDSKRWALLIGCGDYAQPIPPLRGPANDVTLMRRLLRKFGYAAGDIRSLSDNDDESNWPTRANIEREFQYLAAHVRQGDLVFLLLAGHGSQQPDLDPDSEVDPEPDGLDEIFLPRDVGRWVPGRKVQNAIVDDELQSWLTQLVKRGAFVVLVADTCCSGTMARGDTDEGIQSRYVDPIRMLGVPQTLHPTRNRSGKTVSSTEDWLDVAATEQDGRGVVAIYAAQPDQKEWELAIGGGIHGQLSYMLFRILDDQRSPMTWRGLAQRLRYEYTRKRWNHRTLPGIEGTALDRPILSFDRWPVNSSIVMTASRQSWTINRGLLHGIGPGTVLAVKHSGGSEDTDTVLGYVQARTGQSLTATVEPVTFNGRGKMTDLTGLFHCEIVLRNSDDLQISVHTQHEGFSADEAASAAHDRLESVLRSLTEQSGSLVRLTNQRADWYAVVTPAGCWLQRSGSRIPLDEGSEDTSGQRFGPFPVDSHLESMLDDYLTQIARAENLTRLSRTPDNATRPVDVRMEIEVDGDRLQSDSLREVRLADGSQVRLSIRNTGEVNVAVRVFYVESQYAIRPFFPRPGVTADLRHNDIPPGEVLNARPAVEFTINASTTGREHLVTVAVPSTEAGILDELNLLEQPGPGSSVRSRSAELPGPPQSALAQFLSAVVGTTRGGSLNAIPEESGYVIRRVSWIVE